MEEFYYIIGVAVFCFILYLISLWEASFPPVNTSGVSPEVEKLAKALAKAVLRKCKMQLIGGLVLFLLFCVLFYDLPMALLLIILSFTAFVCCISIKIHSLLEKVETRGLL